VIIYSTLKLGETAREVLKEWEVSYDDSSDAEVILAWPTQVTQILDRAPKLKYIQTFSAGVDGLPFDKLPKGVRVFSNAGAYSLPVAEHAWALVLALAKMVNRRERNAQSYMLTRKTLLVIGCGGIGSKVAQIGKSAFSMWVLGVSRSFKSQDFDERHSINELPELLSRADVSVISLPLNKHTRSLFDYKMLSCVKQNSIMVNVGRAELVVEDDLKKVLLERPDFRFGTDVFWRKNGREEFESELWSYPNFMGTPHTAGADSNREVFEEAVLQAVKNVRTLLTTGSAQNEVKVEDYL
jgi:Phosphoglycerate dehydrogenase and related dehydrogenases